MTGSADDAMRDRLDRVAGVSRRAPVASYFAAGLSFGEAVLRRSPAHGRWESLTLSLTPDAAAASGKAGGSRSTPVEFPMRHWLELFAVAEGEAAEAALGLRALLVDHGLLSNPSWLVDASSKIPLADASVAGALETLRASLSRTTDAVAACPACAPPVEHHAVQFPRYTRSRGAYGDQDEFKRMLGVFVPARDAARDAPGPECPHAAMRREALRALCVQHPELAFEACLLLVPAPTMNPARFVTSPAAMAVLLGLWLTPQSYVARGERFVGRHPPRLIRPTPPEQLDGLSKGERAALDFAAQSWGADGPLGRFVRPMNNPSNEMPVMSNELALPPVALLWLDGVAKPAPPDAAPSIETPDRPVAQAAPIPGQPLVTAELRALGYSDARVRALLKAGTLERVGVGRFLWKG